MKPSSRRVFAYSVTAAVAAVSLIGLSRVPLMVRSDEEGGSEKKNEEEPKPFRISPKCNKYNTFTQRLQWAERKNRCHAENGCELLGRRFTGLCIDKEGFEFQEEAEVFKEAFLSENQKNDINNIDSGGGGAAFRTDSFDYKVRRSSADAGTLLPPISTLVNEQINAAAVDSIRDSQDIANEMAKKLILDALSDEKNTAELGKLLQYIFAANSVLVPTRELIYWSIMLPNAMESSLFQARSQRNYWLENKEGRALSRDQLVFIIDWWLRETTSKDLVVKPLLDWTLQQKLITIDPLCNLVVESLPYAKDHTVKVISDSITENLKSQSIKEAAKDAIVTYLRPDSSSSSSSSPSSTSSSPPPPT